MERRQLTPLPSLFRFHAPRGIAGAGLRPGASIVVDVPAAAGAIRSGEFYFAMLVDGRQFFRRIEAAEQGGTLVLVSGRPGLPAIRVERSDIDTLAKPLAVWMPFREA